MPFARLQQVSQTATAYLRISPRHAVYRECPFLGRFRFKRWLFWAEKGDLRKTTERISLYPSFSDRLGHRVGFSHIAKNRLKRRREPNSKSFGLRKLWTVPLGLPRALGNFSRES